LETGLHVESVRLGGSGRGYGKWLLGLSIPEIKTASQEKHAE